MKIKTDSKKNASRKILVKLTEKLSSIAQSLESTVIDLKQLDEILKGKPDKINRNNRTQTRKPR